MSSTTTTEELPPNPSSLAVLRIEGPDRVGIVAAFAQVLYGHGGNIVNAEQHTDAAANRFFQRIQFDYANLTTDRVALETSLQEVCTRLHMNYQLNWHQTVPSIAIMVSKFDHVLWELLLRHQAGELPCHVALILSNHEDLRPIAAHFAIPYHVFVVTKENKLDQEAAELALLQQHQVQLVVLARYMQIVSDHFCATIPTINIHHSFLPAFMGAKPYHRAHTRGVKLIGATAHYATAELDEGPIIEQDVTRVSHRHSVDDLLRKGRVLEREVLFRAVKAHLEDRIIVYDNKCVVFGD